MKKTKIILVVGALFASTFTSLMIAMNKDSVKEIPLTDLAATYEGEKVDSEGKLLVPFDVAYSTAFKSGNYKYDTTHLLIKLSKDYNKGVNANLKGCGITSIEKFSTANDGDWYKAYLSDRFDINIAIKKARSVSDIIMADYDYIYETASIEDSLVNEDVETYSTTSTDSVGEIIDDVLNNIQVKDQWYLTSCEIQRSWNFLKKNGISAGGDSSVVVAVIDTGVDYNHPDLKANMWVNTKEIPGNGIDDDGNGYVDDVYGASTISDERFHNGDPMDDHGHGTHVAGIIAASNNKEGIVGVAYNSKIMAVKAGQASGVFAQSDIAEAIIYAYENGADVINMSFGGSACSIAVQDALETAYTRCVLVASAGNDGRPNEGLFAIPNYLAALPYVIGVMSVNALGVESGFTNYDLNKYNSVEYELYAPGEAILSTLPNKRYGKLSGTSMAAPIVSGAAALLRSYFKDRDMYPSKYIMAQLCATSETNATCFNPKLHESHNVPMLLDVYDALTKAPKPDVNLLNYYLFDDTSIDENNNGDGVIDANETVNIAAVLRNRWGMSKDTTITIDTLSGAGVANPYVEIVNGTVNFDGVGTYSTKDTLIRNEQNIIKGVENPLVVKISKDCPNDYKIVLNVTITYKNGLDEKDNTEYKNTGTIEFDVRNGVILPSQITSDMVLTSDKYYIIPNSTVINEGVTVTVEPGTKIQFYSNNPKDPYADQYIPYLYVEGSFITQGTLDEPVELFPSEMMSNYAVELKKVNDGLIDLHYTNVINPYISITFADHCDFKDNYSDIYYRLFENGKLLTWTNPTCSYGTFDYCKFSIIRDSMNGRYRINVGNSFNHCLFTEIMNIGLYIGNDNYIKNSVINGDKSIISYTAKYGRIPKIDILGNDDEKTYYLVAINNNINSFNQLMKIKNENDASMIFDYLRNNGYSDWFMVLARNDIEIELATFPWQYTFREYDKDSEYIRMQWIDSTHKEINSTDRTYGNACACEIPNHNDGTPWTKQELEAEYKEYLQKGLNNYSFSGNAILNNYNNPNVDEWTRIMARDRDTNETKLYETLSVANNYWGTTDIDLINKQIVDYDDFKSLADIVVGNYLTTPPEDTFPFVYDAYLLNSKGERVNKVGNETVTFVAEFNRDMDTTIPLRFRFGSASPYADYEVSGSYVNKRRWEGTYTLKTTIENGLQYMNITNGRADSDHFLTLADSLRYTFNLDTTAAQAMIMQGEATATGVKLTWEQDDFDTLLGYNVYRSTKEDGLYTKLNSSVIPYDVKEFFDDTVEPGKLYYYNFTIVQTDFNESKPSGKISLMSMDTMAPNIYHTPVRTAYTNSNLVIGATITDNLQVKEATLYYRIKDGTWKSAKMTNNNSRYSAIVDASDITTAGLEYYIEAFDGVSYTYKGSESNPYSVVVKLAVDDSSLGDVDGDGVITNKDALMLLQAANDLLNLTEDQFMRADINKDGELSASEALRILQYVSGKVTTIID